MNSWWKSTKWTTETDQQRKKKKNGLLLLKLKAVAAATTERKTQVPKNHLEITMNNTSGPYVRPHLFQCPLVKLVWRFYFVHYHQHWSHWQLWTFFYFKWVEQIFLTVNLVQWTRVIHIERRRRRQQHERPNRHELVFKICNTYY